MTCAVACATQETACASAGYGANFQAYLTCVGNVGSYADVQQNVDTTNPAMPAHYTTTVVTGCTAEAAALATECGTVAPGPSGAGSSPGGKPSAKGVQEVAADTAPSRRTRSGMSGGLVAVILWGLAPVATSWTSR